MTGAATATVSQPQRALVHPWLDFWLLGGLSYFCLGLMWVATDVFKLDLKYEVPWWAFYAAFVVNYPHFAYSYQLFYKNFTHRLFGPETEMASRIRLAVAGIVAPMLMIGYFAYVGFAKNPDLLGYGVSAMLFFVGWHYVKQGYGVLITASLYRSIFYSLWQKRVLYVNAYAVWIYAWVKANISFSKSIYFDVAHFSLDLPDSWQMLSGWAVVLTSAASAFVLLWAWLKEKKGFSLSGFVGYTSASYFWILLPQVHPLFFYFIPLFHSLQYLVFVYKFKKSEFQSAAEKADSQQADRRRYVLMLLLFIAGGFVLGGLMMDWLPKLIDRHYSFDNVAFSRSYFLVTFLLFINIHHFFIDSAFWRRDNRDVQQYLFRA